MSARLVRISTRQTGERRTVRVYIYDTREEMQQAAQRFHPIEDQFRNAEGVCQSYVAERINDAGEVTATRQPIIVRFHRAALGVGVVSHELNHAAVGLYASTLAPDTLALDVLHVANETLAHLQSDLTRALTRRLWALGYYTE